MELNEGYTEITELEKLSIEIVQFFADKNSDFIKRIINGLDSKEYFNYESGFIYDIVPDKSIYPVLKDFIDKTDINIRFIDNFSSSGVFIPNGRKSGGEIWLKIEDYTEFITEIGYGIEFYNLKNEWSVEKATQLLRITLGSEIRSILIHELQHAYDDFRSNGNYAHDKKSNNYYKNLSYKPLSPDAVMDDKTRQIYLTLPHEYWARFSEFTTKRYMGGSFEQILATFKQTFSGYNLFSDNVKNRLQKALYKFWDEKNNIKKENTMKLNKTELTEMIQKITKTLIKEGNRNVKTVNLRLTDIGVKMFQTIPTFKNLLAPNQLNNLISGDNIININHYIYSKLIQVTGYDQTNMSVSEITGKDEQPIEESTYEMDSTDPNLATKTAKLQSDPTLFNKDTDKIEIGNTNESILVTKNQIVKMMVEAKAVRDKNGDYVKAIKKADREMEMDDKGPGFKSKDKAHKNDKKYNRKSFTKNELIEMLTKKVDVIKETNLSFSYKGNSLPTSDMRDWARSKYEDGADKSSDWVMDEFYEYFHDELIDLSYFEMIDVLNKSFEYSPDDEF